MYINPRTNNSWPITTPLWRAPDDGEYLNLSLSNSLSLNEINTQERSIWRYKKAFRGMPKQHYSLGEGLTPLVENECGGIPVTFKLEYFSPSGSFKDRGICVLLNYLKNSGIQKFVEDSSGNAGSSIAMYSAFMGLTCTVVAPASAPKPKLIQMKALGVDLKLIDGTRDEVALQALDLAKKTFYAGHTWHPFFLEGTKSIAYEIWEQFKGNTPDCIVAPLGQGGNILGAYIGFSELLQAGHITKIPRLYGAQAENCAPFHCEFHNIKKQKPEKTIADGIAASQPVRLKDVMNAHILTGGETVAVSENEIISNLKELHHKGFFVEPTCASATAGFKKLVAAGKIKNTEKTVILLTGSGLKAIDVIADL